MNRKNIGILAMQGGFEAHAKSIAACRLSHSFIKRPKDLENIDGLIFPGGESTTQFDLLEKANLTGQIIDFCKAGKPVFATCAGVVLLARFKILNIDVTRNAYGSQKFSFEAALKIPHLEITSFPGVFIRAPKVKVNDSSIKILSTFEADPVLFQKNHILAATFHPELTQDLRLHEFFASFFA